MLIKYSVNYINEANHLPSEEITISITKIHFKNKTINKVQIFNIIKKSLKALLMPNTLERRAILITYLVYRLNPSEFVSIDCSIQKGNEFVIFTYVNPAFR